MYSIYLQDVVMTVSIRFISPLLLSECPWTNGEDLPKMSQSYTSLFGIVIYFICSASYMQHLVLGCGCTFSYFLYLVQKLSPLHSCGKHQWINKLVGKGSSLAQTCTPLGNSSMCCHRNISDIFKLTRACQFTLADSHPVMRCSVYIDPKTTSLPMSTLPVIKEYQPCLRNNSTATSFRDHFKRVTNTAVVPPCTRKVKPTAPKLNKPHTLGHQLPGLNANNVHLAVLSSESSSPSSAPPPSQEGNTLPLVYNRRAQKRPDAEPLPGSIFSQCPEPGGWYVVHPDWRLEPGIKGVWSL